MIGLSAYRGHDVGVMGLGRSGLAAARALAAGGARVAAWDDDAGRREAAAASGIACASPAERLGAIDLIVWSPGIPHLHPRPHPLATSARRAGRPLVADIELLCRAEPDAEIVGITGTNGKSTTTALVGHVLASAGRRAAVGGNLGPPALGLEPLGAGGVYVLELSSYQLDLMPEARCGIAVLLNVSPDHLDRHGGMHGYVAAKARVFDRAEPGDVAVIGVDDPYGAWVRDRVARGPRRIVPVTVGARRPGAVWVEAGRLVDETGDAPLEVVDLRACATLPGAHNWQNAAAAYAVCRALGVEAPVIATALRTFPGLAHRQETVATIGGVRWINDSKATNAESAARALASYPRIHWILGGLAKDEGVEHLAPWFDRVVHAYLIGAATDRFAAVLQDRVPYTKAGTLEAAVAAAHRGTSAEREGGSEPPVVLLSPACASFDQFASFEARGDAFRALVAALAGRSGEASP